MESSFSFSNSSLLVTENVTFDRSVGREQPVVETKVIREQDWVGEEEEGI